MASNKCAVCWKDDAERCAGCKSCSYCSKECQRSDWKSHKLLCKVIAAEPPRPSPSHLRAIHFPDDKQTPELVWINCSLDDENPTDPGLPDVSLLRNLIQRDANDNIGQSKTWWNNRLKKNTSHMIEFYYRDNFYNDGSRSTASLNAAVKLHGLEKRDWRGPLVVLAILIERNEKEDDATLNYTDMTLADFRSIIDHSLGYEKRMGMTMPPQLAAMGFQSLSLEPDNLSPPPIGEKQDGRQQKNGEGSKPAATGAPPNSGKSNRDSILGVQLDCEEMGSDSRHIRVARTHPIRNGQGDISPLSCLIGMPLRLCKNPEKFTFWGNQRACYMMVNLDIDNPTWGLAPNQWRYDINNVLVVREDGQNLTRIDLINLRCFCADFMDVVEDAAGEGTREAREEAMEFLTPENYRRKVQEYKTNR